MPRPRALAALLVLSTVNLALMIPGGLVETRNFPNYSVAVLVAFNVFLTVLGLGSAVLTYRLLRGARPGWLPVLAGGAYVLVYGLDLLHVFPVAEAPMSVTLASMEWIGTVLGLAIVATAAAGAGRREDDPRGASPLPIWLLVAMAGLTLAIVAFATISAM